MQLEQEDNSKKTKTRDRVSFANAQSPYRAPKPQNPKSAF